VRLFTGNGYNFADRFPMIVAAVESLPVRSCFVDGEAIVVDHNGLSVFDLLRYRQSPANQPVPRSSQCQRRISCAQSVPGPKLSQDQRERGWARAPLAA
jgi:hypothetical protein